MPAKVHRSGKPFGKLISSWPESADRPGRQPFTWLDIPYAWASPPLSEELSATIAGQFEQSPVQASKAVLDHQRGTEECPIGCYGQLTIITKQGVAMQIVQRWEDKWGNPT